MTGEVKMLSEDRGGIALPHLRAWRLWFGMSPDELARRATTSASTVRGIERGLVTARYETVAKLAGALGLPRLVLINYSPEQEGARHWERCRLKDVSL